MFPDFQNGPFDPLKRALSRRETNPLGTRNEPFHHLKRPLQSPQTTPSITSNESSCNKKTATIAASTTSISWPPSSVHSMAKQG